MALDVAPSATPVRKMAARPMQIPYWSRTRDSRLLKGGLRQRVEHLLCALGVKVVCAWPMAASSVLAGHLRPRSGGRTTLPYRSDDVLLLKADLRCRIRGHTHSPERRERWFGIF